MSSILDILEALFIVPENGALRRYNFLSVKGLIKYLKKKILRKEELLKASNTQWRNVPNGFKSFSPQ